MPLLIKVCCTYILKIEDSMHAYDLSKTCQLMICFLFAYHLKSLKLNLNPKRLKCKINFTVAYP